MNSYYKVKEYRNSLKTALSAKKSQQSSDIPPYKTAEAQNRGFYLTIPYSHYCTVRQVWGQKPPVFVDAHQILECSKTRSHALFTIY